MFETSLATDPPPKVDQGQFMRGVVAGLLGIAATIGVGIAAPGSVIRSVAIDRTTVNLAAGEIVTVTVDFAKAGAATALFVDRDGYAVRSLAKAQPVKGGPTSFPWDGRDDAGQLVANEAYSLRVEWRGAGGAVETYFPAKQPASMIAVDPTAYDRRSATLSYHLSRPSRVHVQAGTAVLDPTTRQMLGPVMKTIVNREPRAGGMVAEHWSGFDESGTVFVPDLRDFVIAIAITPLPENAVIAFGNRQRTFVETIAARRGPSLLEHNRGGHHAGLTAADDISPELVLEPLNAVWSAADRVWTMSQAGAMRLRVSVKGPTAPAFRAQPATLFRFVDGRAVGAAAAPPRDGIIEVPLEARPGTRRISINWRSEWGPLAANTIQVRTP